MELRKQLFLKFRQLMYWQPPAGTDLASLEWLHMEEAAVRCFRKVGGKILLFTCLLSGRGECGIFTNPPFPFPFPSPSPSPILHNILPAGF